MTPRGTSDAPSGAVLEFLGASTSRNPQPSATTVSNPEITTMDHRKALCHATRQLLGTGRVQRDDDPMEIAEATGLLVAALTSAAQLIQALERVADTEAPVTSPLGIIGAWAEDQLTTIGEAGAPALLLHHARQLATYGHSALVEIQAIEVAIDEESRGIAEAEARVDARIAAEAKAAGPDRTTTVVVRSAAPAATATVTVAPKPCTRGKRAV